ncbi:MAG: hypothetical protein ACM3YO_07020 [Bacteroidota bacterium]
METVSIPLEELDKDNLAWVNKYVSRIDALLLAEQEGPTPHSPYCEFLEGELEAYRELLERCVK